MLLGHGVELILKARLLREHWSLVFEDPKTASHKKFKSGDIDKTAGFDQCIMRLENIVGLDFKEEHKKALRSHRKYRNQIEHFEISVPELAVEAAACRVLSFVLDFVRDEFDEGDLAEKETTLLGEIR